jgi:predicted Fe-S protein YdhL (DUF1289 family)
MLSKVGRCGGQRKKTERPRAVQFKALNRWDWHVTEAAVLLCSSHCPCSTYRHLCKGCKRRAEQVPWNEKSKHFHLFLLHKFALKFKFSGKTKQNKKQSLK